MLHLHLASNTEHATHMNATNFEIRETDEQATLRENFLGTRGTERALICQCCCTGSKAISRCWESGYSEINGQKVRARKCNNCGYIEYWKPRAKRLEKPTPAQSRAIERIRRFFDRDGIVEFKTEPTDYGVVWVKVRTGGGVFHERGGFFKVPRNGGRVECVSSYSLYTKAEHFTAMVN